MAEKLVLASGAISLLSTAPRETRAVEIMNLGPNPIWVEIGNTPVVNKSRKIAPGEVWGIEGDVLEVCDLKAIASTADQLTGAATIVTEID